LHRLPVVFCLDRAGITGDNGPSHHGVYDLALLAKVPGMRVLAPSSAQELQVMLHDALKLADEGPVAIRYPNGTAPQVGEHEVGVGQLGNRLRRGDGSVCILAIGKLVTFANQAAIMLAAQGIEATVWDVRSCAPLDPAMIADAAAHRSVVTCEDGIRDGGIGMTIADQVHAVAPDLCIDVLGLPGRFIPQGKPDRILAQLGLDAEGIAATVRRRLATITSV
jgi:1-deoxy-D-xylulose-5-phosphate synthase